MAKKPEIPDVMVERKLSGIYDTVSVDIPWKAFQEYLQTCQGYLDDNYSVAVTEAELMAKKRVIAKFEKQMAEFFQSLVANPDYYFGWDIDSTLDSAFKTEIKEAEERMEEEQRLETERLLREANARMVDGGVVLTIDPQDYNQVQNILRLYQIKYK